MALLSRLELRLAARLLGSGDHATPTFETHPYEKAIAYANGTGANQADLYWSDQRTVGSGVDDDLDLVGGLSGPLGGTLSFARIKGLLLYASEANTTELLIVRPVGNGVPFISAEGGYIVLMPGGTFSCMWPGSSAIPVSGGTSDIRITNGAGASATYDVHILGASA